MVNAVIRDSRSSREVKAPRRSSFLVRTPNHCSIMFSQDACLGVQVTVILGWAASQARVAREVWLEPLSMIRWMSRPGGIDWSSGVRPAPRPQRRGDHQRLAAAAHLAVHDPDGHQPARSPLRHHRDSHHPAARASQGDRPARPLAPRRPGSRREQRARMSADSCPVSVLAVMAHPDDGELWAGGPLALHARDAAVTLAVNEHEPARMAEAAAGAAILGVRLQPLAVPCTAAAIVDLITATP